MVLAVAKTFTPEKVLLLASKVEEAAVMVKLSPRLNDWPLTVRSWPVT